VVLGSACVSDEERYIFYKIKLTAQREIKRYISHTVNFFFFFAGRNVQKKAAANDSESTRVMKINTAYKPNEEHFRAG
jgi:hypothetical protein